MVGIPVEWQQQQPRMPHYLYMTELTRQRQMSHSHMPYECPSRSVLNSDDFTHYLCLQALAKVQAASDSSASHNCWAYRVGADARSTDDGEPGGTAGRPILAAIDGEWLDRVCVLVIRCSVCALRARSMCRDGRRQP